MAKAALHPVNRLSLRSKETFCGRKEELATLMDSLAADGPLVSYIHGSPGLGKTALLAHFNHLATAEGASVVMMDCRIVEPTPKGYLNQWSLFSGQNLLNIASAAQIIAKTEGMTVLCLDHYDSFRLLDTWLRQDLMPNMPENFRLVMASRQPPLPSWLTSANWHGLIRVLALSPLDKAAAREILQQANIPVEQCAPIANRAHGNPLALKLGAAAALSHASMPYQTAALEDVIQELAQVFLADVTDPALRDALEKASVARRITHSLLRALPGVSESCFDDLRRLSLVDTWPDGLRLHDAVREAIASTLRATDPQRYFAARRATWVQLCEENRKAPGKDLWRTTADMLFLIENPVIREAFFPSGDPELSVEPAHQNDWMQIREITRRHDGESGVSAMTAWWQHNPEAFRVVRNRKEQVVSFYCMAEANTLHPAVLEADPIACSWQSHRNKQMLPPQSHTLFLRRWLASDKGETPSAGQAACWLDAKRAYMELRPDLHQVYLTIVDLPLYAKVATQLGFQHLPEQTKALGNQVFQTAVLNFGPGSVDGWISRLVGDEMGISQNSPLNYQRRTLVFNETEVSLTPLEFQLAAYLESRAGITATRFEILTEVWGHVDETCSSNVVDAVVKTLRQKLGSSSQLIETVRGFGYRWQQM